MRPITRDLLTSEITEWHQQGLIDRSLLTTLLERYARRGEFLAALLKWLGIFAIFQLGLAVLTFIALMAKSAGLPSGCPGSGEQTRPKRDT